MMCSICRRLGTDAYAADGVQSVQNCTHTPDIWQIYDLAIRVV
jgi:hypothetical protein